MDAKSLVLTANTETVYWMGLLDLKSDGPTVFEGPPKMLAAAMDILQRYLADIEPLGPEKGMVASTSSCRLATQARCHKATSSASPLIITCSFSFAVSRKTERPSLRWRS